MTDLLRVENLRIRRGKRLVLDVPALTLRRGEVLALLGPNGAGKSTLLLSIAGLLKPEQGRITFNGQVLNRKNALALRRRMALVLQAPLLLDDSVFNNVAIGLRYRRLPGDLVRQRVTHWLERLHIAHLAQRRASQLSGGEAQRVSLARAFVLEPELLLLDEPFSALDAPSRRQLLQDTQALLASTSATALFVTHDMREAAVLAQRAAIIFDGQIRQAGDLQALRENPVSADIRRFLQT